MQKQMDVEERKLKGRRNEIQQRQLQLELVRERLMSDCEYRAAQLKVQ